MFKSAGTPASTTSQSTETSAPTLTTSLFDLPPGRLGVTTITSRVADRANADIDTEPANDKSEAAETVPGDDDSEFVEPGAADDNVLESRGLDKATDQRWIKPPTT